MVVSVTILEDIHMEAFHLVTAEEVQVEASVALVTGEVDRVEVVVVVLKFRL